MHTYQRRNLLTGTKRKLPGESANVCGLGGVVGAGGGPPEAGAGLIEGRGQKMEWTWESAQQGLEVGRSGQPEQPPAVQGRTYDVWVRAQDPGLLAVLLE